MTTLKWHFHVLATSESEGMIYYIENRSWVGSKGEM